MIGMEWNEICKGNVLKGSVVWMADLETLIAVKFSIVDRFIPVIFITNQCCLGKKC